MSIAHSAASEATVIPYPGSDAAPRPRGLRVHALGALRVSFGRLPIRSLGGPKAGSQQALGLFAFLFDRSDRGVDKDEAVEMIWPDIDIPVADTAFHRTMLGLRGTLRGGGMGEGVAYRNGRYVLASGLVSWSDTMELEQLIAESATAHDGGTRIRLLEQCRTINSADYMDDCPFFGTSVYVEARRGILRQIREAVLRELAELYALAGHHALAAIRLAEARSVVPLAEVRGGMVQLVTDRPR